MDDFPDGASRSMYTYPMDTRRGAVGRPCPEFNLFDFTTPEVVQARLQQAGFREFSMITVPHKDNLPWNLDWIVLEARKQRQQPESLFRPT
jgi:hypothetical protein